jgi:hypothetical protein
MFLAADTPHISALGDGSDGVQAATPPAQDRARQPSAKEAQKKEPARASLVPARNR